MPGPSPYRLALKPEDANPRIIECPRSVQTLVRAKAFARNWAGDVGLRGDLTVEKRVGPEWIGIAVARVRSSEISGWL
jgi:hypothetical protein